MAEVHSRTSNWDSDEALLSLLTVEIRGGGGGGGPQRGLQQGTGSGGGGGSPPTTTPNYTSPALPDAIGLTPDPFKNDTVVQQARDAAGAGACGNATSLNYCMIPFFPPTGAFLEESPTIGVVLYGGAFVDPRSYSVLASRLADRYGFAVVIPIFHHDLPFAPCSTGRPQLAARLLPKVQKWVLMGHSFGGTAAAADLWAIANSNGSNHNASSASSPPTLDAIAGLALLASDVGPVPPCGNIDFSNLGFPVALVTASNDLIQNKTRFEENLANVPPNNTLLVDVLGGNHGGFGSYNASDRVEILGPRQVDGPMQIDPTVQWDLSAAAAANVASMSGAEFPQQVAVPAPSPSATSGGKPSFCFFYAGSSSWALVVALSLMLRRKFL